MDTSTSIFQPPFVTTALGGGGGLVAEGLEASGRLFAVAGAVVGVIIMLILVLIGRVKLRDKRTASAQMTVVSATGCQRQPPGGSGFVCTAVVAFTTPDGKHHTSAPIIVTGPSPVAVGSVVRLQYDPGNPADIAQDPSPKALGWGLIGVGLLVGVGSVATAAMAFKSKGVAAGVGAMGAIGMVVR